MGAGESPAVDLVVVEYSLTGKQGNGKLVFPIGRVINRRESRP